MHDAQRSTPSRAGIVHASAVALLVGAISAALLAACGTASTAAVGACRASSVRIAAGQFGVGRGHFGGALLFWNEGPSACTLRGYPRAVAVPASRGHAVEVATAPRGYVGGLLAGATRVPVVTLAPGGVASAVIEGTTVTPTSARCTRYGSLRVGIPGSRVTTAMSIETSGCSHLEVHPIVQGRTGNQLP